MKNDFDRLIKRLDMGEERTSGLQDSAIETSKTEKQRHQGLKNKQNKTKQTEDPMMGDNTRV